MMPVKHARADVCYRGPSADIGDLWCMRERPGVITVVFELDDSDRATIAGGGRIMLTLHNEPIPPIAIRTIDEAMCRPVAEHGWKDIPELSDPERGGP